MRRPAYSLTLLAALFVAAAGVGQRWRASWVWPYPPLERLLLDRTGLQDVATITAGFRALAADVAWIQLLQYVGGSSLPGEDSHRTYDLLQHLTLRVTRIDPYFRRAYLYSASMLAFFNNINRPAEALALLEEGIRANPTYWPLRTYAAAIGFKNKNQFDEMAPLMEEAVTQPDCPVIIKSILANGYKINHRPKDAERMWRLILADPLAVDYYNKARAELAAMGYEVVS